MVVPWETSPHLTYLTGGSSGSVQQCWDVDSTGEKSLLSLFPPWSPAVGMGRLSLCCPWWQQELRSCHVPSEQAVVFSVVQGEFREQWASTSLWNRVSLQRRAAHFPCGTYMVNTLSQGVSPMGHSVEHSEGTLFHLSSSFITSSQVRCCCPG